MRLICGEFEELDLSEIGPVDLCIADPPDNIGKGYDGYSDRLPEPEYRRLIKEWLRRSCEITNGPVFFTFAERWIPDVEDGIREHGLRLIERIWWYCTFGQCARPRSTPSIRPVYWLPTRRVFPEGGIRVESDRQLKYNDKRANPNGKMPDNFWDFNRVCGTHRERREWHPCQLRESMAERIIRGHSNPGDTVLDPFVGSGTTVYCCDSLDRRVVGIDQSQFYLDKIREEREPAAERIAARRAAERKIRRNRCA